MVASYGSTVHTTMGSEVKVMCGPLRRFLENIWPIHEEARCLHAFENLHMSIRTEKMRPDGLMPVSPLDDKLSAIFANLPHLKRFVVEWVLTKTEREPVTSRLEEGFKLLLRIGYKIQIEPEIFLVPDHHSMERFADEADRRAGLGD
jgi:hypothetical protein